MTYRLIEPFQKGETDTFMKHAEAAVELLVDSPGALLVFLGVGFPNCFRWGLDAALKLQIAVPLNDQGQNSPRHSPTS